MVILSVLGFTLFAISAASCAETSVLNMQVIIAVVSGKPPIPKCDTAPTSRERHDKHACADRLFKRKSHKRREYKEHHHAAARADESANPVPMPAPMPAKIYTIILIYSSIQL